MDLIALAGQEASAGIKLTERLAASGNGPAVNQGLSNAQGGIVDRLSGTVLTPGRGETAHTLQGQLETALGPHGKEYAQNLQYDKMSAIFTSAEPSLAASRNAMQQRADAAMQKAPGQKNDTGAFSLDGVLKSVYAEASVTDAATNRRTERATSPDGQQASSTIFDKRT